MNRRISAVLAAGVLWSAQAVASPILYEVESLGGDAWRYTYTVGNDTSAPIESFRIYFDYGLYEFDLVEVEPFPGFVAEEVDPETYAGPADWDVWVAPTDNILGEEFDGFYDALALGDPIAPMDFTYPIATAELLSGFSVAFRYLGSGTPGSQFFELLDAFGTEVRGTGFTEPMRVTVSEPGTPLLLAVGLLMAGWSRARSRAA
jgi:hypothetical protein